MTRQLIYEVGASRAAVRVLLPVDERSLAMVNRQLDQLVAFGVLSQKQREKFLADLQYLPATAVQLNAADAAYKTGLNWHDSAAISRGFSHCNCSVCLSFHNGRR